MGAKTKLSSAIDSAKLGAARNPVAFFPNQNSPDRATQLEQEIHSSISQLLKQVKGIEKVESAKVADPETGQDCVRFLVRAKSGDGLSESLQWAQLEASLPAVFG